jgi:hypothetical protein
MWHRLQPVVVSLINTEVPAQAKACAANLFTIGAFSTAPGSILLIRSFARGVCLTIHKYVVIYAINFIIT